MTAKRTRGRATPHAEDSCGCWGSRLVRRPREAGQTRQLLWNRHQAAEQSIKTRSDGSFVARKPNEVAQRGLKAGWRQLDKGRGREAARVCMKETSRRSHQRKPHPPGGAGSVRLGRAPARGCRCDVNQRTGAQVARKQVHAVELVMFSSPGQSHRSCGHA